LLSWGILKKEKKLEARKKCKQNTAKSDRAGAGQCAAGWTGEEREVKRSPEVKEERKHTRSQ
jgi:hypothetical protein